MDLNKRVRVGIDATPLIYSKTGIANYIFYYLDELIKSRPNEIFYLYAPKLQGDLTYFQQFSNVIIRTNNLFSFKYIFWVQITLAHQVFHDKIDVFWGGGQQAPLFKRKKLKIILTVHDLFYLFYPNSMSLLRRWTLRFLYPSMFRRSDYIIPNSFGTAKHLKDAFGLDSYDVIHPPIKPWLKPIDCETLMNWLSKKGLNYKEFLLTIGTLEPRKNYHALLSTYASVLEKNDPATVLPLVMIGEYGWNHSEIKAILERLKEKYPYKIHATGYATDDEQWHYLAGARYLLMLSQYEGYGLPVAEARVCGTSVICTDLPELREAALEKGIFLKREEIQEKLPEYCLHVRQKHCENPIANEYPTIREKAKKFSHLLDKIQKSRA